MHELLAVLLALGFVMLVVGIIEVADRLVDRQRRKK